MASSNARLARAFFCLSVLLWLPGLCAAADGLSPVRIVVPAAAQGGASLQARVLAEALARVTAVPHIVDHRSGIAGAAGAAVVAGSPADGRVLLLANASLVVQAAGPAATAAAEVLRGLRPLAPVSTTPLVLTVHPQVPARNAVELLALARAPRSRLNAGAPAAGGLGHLAAALLLPPAVAAAITPFRGSGPALRALADGRIDLAFAAAPALLPHWTAGRLRMLAVTAPSAHSAIARLPRLDESLQGFPTVLQWYALFSPRGIPDETVLGLQRPLEQVLRDDTVAAFFAAHALTAAGGDGAALEALLRRDIERYGSLLRRTALVP